MSHDNNRAILRPSQLALLYSRTAGYIVQSA